MKLVRKLTFALLGGICLVLFLNAYLRARREIDYFERDMRRDQKEVGHAYANAVERIWRKEGEAEALRFVVIADHKEDEEIRWVLLEAPPGDPFYPSVPPEKLTPCLREKDPALRHGGRQYTYIPVTPREGVHGALEISESLEEESRYIRGTLLRSFLMAGAVILVAGILAFLLGDWIVGSPVRQLIGKARRVGGGDFAGPLALKGRDELSELAGELNTMAGRLAEAMQRIEEETSARIRALDQLRHADRLMTVGKLASGIAHELGTPLNVVWSHAKMIASGEIAPGEAPESAGIIAEQAERMTRIIRQLLDFARPSKLKKTVTDLREVLQATRDLLSSLAEKHAVEIERAWGEDPVHLEIDPGQLQQVLSNIVMNGIQAMPGGGKLTLGLRIERAKPPADHGGAEDEYVCLFVRDRGEGIPPDAMRHLFEPFFTTKEVGKGTGLGLSVSRGIVREHGGWIGVESEVGKGSCFSVYLPRSGRTP